MNFKKFCWLKENENENEKLTKMELFFCVISWYFNRVFWNSYDLTIVLLNITFKFLNSKE
ncbi:hypothetical protein BN1002_01124 [Bacillus sp. B-jedd]|nr:hypothetical protein BN1002_01124 [Bacillus sp. B-jedd]